MCKVGSLWLRWSRPVGDLGHTQEERDALSNELLCKNWLQATTEADFISFTIYSVSQIIHVLVETLENSNEQKLST